MRSLRIINNWETTRRQTKQQLQHRKVKDEEHGPRASNRNFARRNKAVLEPRGQAETEDSKRSCKDLTWKIVNICHIMKRCPSWLQCQWCVWIALSWLSLRFSLACMYFHSFFFLCKLSYDLVLSANLFINNREEFRRCWLEQISCEIKTWLKLCMLNIT
jgi:hypothetical protein